jgi:hypothetical protein
MFKPSGRRHCALRRSHRPHRGSAWSPAQLASCYLSRYFLRFPAYDSACRDKTLSRGAMAHNIHFSCLSTMRRASTVVLVQYLGLHRIGGKTGASTFTSCTRPLCWRHAEDQTGLTRDNQLANPSSSPLPFESPASLFRKGPWWLGSYVGISPCLAMTLGRRERSPGLDNASPMQAGNVGEPMGLE